MAVRSKMRLSNGRGSHVYEVERSQWLPTAYPPSLSPMVHFLHLHGDGDLHLLTIPTDLLLSSVYWFLLITLPLHAGMFQGSLLGSLLFSVYILSFSDLTSFQSITCDLHADYHQIPTSNLHLFAIIANGNSIFGSHSLHLSFAYIPHQITLVLP